MRQLEWILSEQNAELAAELSAALAISPLVGQLLINRGITGAAEGRRFLRRDLNDTPDPQLMLGIAPAVKRIKSVLNEGERVIIYGDYDADGQTATALLVRGLRELAAQPEQIDYYLPDRLREGYGLNRAALTELAKGARMVVTVDCGISALTEVAHANSLGLEMIVTDHHQPGAQLPAAAAILNPKQLGCGYPFKELAGVGVALKLLQALGLPQSKWTQWLDLVALGTVADLVPLQGENRILVHHGLRQMVATENIGLRALLETAQVKQPTAGDLGFRLGPRLNAAGRLGDSSRGVRLLLTEDPGEAQELALELHLENARRQDLEDKVLQEAIEVTEKYGLQKRSALVVWGAHWHPGVIGIAASRLVERYYLPTVVLSIQDGEATGSARSIAGLDLHAALTECAPLFSGFGGHTMAAGLSLAADNLLAFQGRFEQICAATLEPQDYIPKLYIDGQAVLSQITPELTEELGKMEPYGLGNPGPLLASEVSVIRTRTVGRDSNHLQLTVGDASFSEFQVIAFEEGKRQDALEKYAEGVNIAFLPYFNEWRGKREVQLRLRAWEPKRIEPCFVYDAVVEQFPWSFEPRHLLSSAFQKQEPPDLKGKRVSSLDLRGAWDKAGELKARRLGQGPALILVNTPAAALKLCRRLRIEIPGGRTMIAFDHEWLSPQERSMLKKGNFSWLVSTGFGLDPALKWPSVWFWDPPLNPDNYRIWASFVQEGGELAALFGPKDLRAKRAYLQQACPDRSQLARIYTLLKRPGGKTELPWAYGQLNALDMLAAFPAALGVFQELDLWEMRDGVILYKPAPARKLDLHQTVLYNEITMIREQSLQYLKRCLERGFFQDGLEGEN